MRRTLLTGSLLVLLSAASPGVALAQNDPPAGPSAADRAEARRNFLLGVAAYGRRDHEAALGSFQTAYRLAPHPSVRVNMANCYVELRRPAEALFHFEQFLAESPGAPAAQRAVIERQVQTLLAQLSEVSVRVTPSDAIGLVVTVDGQTVSTVRPARIAPGHHVVEAFAEGFATTRREVDTVARTPLDLSLTLERAAPPALPPPVPATPPTPPPPAPLPPAPSTPPEATPLTAPAPPLAPVALAPERPRAGMRPAAFFAVVGVTAASAVVWGVAGGLALSARSDYDAAQQRLLAGADRASSLAARQDAQDSMRRLAVLSDVAMGVTLAGVVASVVLGLRTDFRPATVDVAAAPLPGGGALAVAGRF